jgi:hypothetical protein
MPIRFILIALIACVAFAGCGRRSNLDAPGELQAEETPFDQRIVESSSPGASEPLEARPVDGPDRPFFLDPLI